VGLLVLILRMHTVQIPLVPTHLHGVIINHTVSLMFRLKSISACPTSKPHISHHCSHVNYQFMLFPILTIPPRSHCTTFLDAGDMDATASAPVLPFCSLPHRLNSLHWNCHLNCIFQLNKQTNKQIFKRKNRQNL